MLDWIRRRLRPAAETRASGFTAQVMAERDGWISGRRGVAELTTTVQACISLWEAGFAIAEVRGTDLLDRATMAMTARSCALRGEALFLATAEGLVPAVDWDVSTRNGRPKAYRLSIPEAGGGRSFTALAGEVLHLRIAADAMTPWIGAAPLRRASLSAGLLHAVETALSETYQNAPFGSQIVPLPEGAAEDMATMRDAFRGRRGATLVVEGVAQATAAGMNPQLGQRRENLTPDLAGALPAETLAAAREGVMLAFGVLPALGNRATTGPVVREAQRHLAQWVLQPLAELLAAEASAKLGGRVEIDVMTPTQAFDAGGSARALGAIVKALAEAKAAGLSPAELGMALKMVDWNDGRQLLD